MANGYLGTKQINWREVKEFSHFTPKDWSLYFIERYGMIDGAHHKQWLLDQVVKILTGCEIQLGEASWEGGETEYRFSIVGETDEYKAWVDSWLEYDEDGELMYSEWDNGVTP